MSEVYNERGMDKPHSARRILNIYILASADYQLSANVYSSIWFGVMIVARGRETLNTYGFRFTTIMDVSCQGNFCVMGRKVSCVACSPGFDVNLFAIVRML